MKDGFKSILSLFVSLLMIYIVIRHVGEIKWDGFIWEKKSIFCLILASVVVYFANVMRAFRWKIILNNPEKYTLQKTVSSTFLGLWFNIITTTGGNVIIKPFHLALITQSQYWKIFGSCILERFFDAISSLLILIFAWIFLNKFVDYNFFTAFSISVWVTIISLLMLLIRPYHKIFTFTAYLLPKRIFRRIRIFLHQINKGGVSFFNMKVVFNCVLITVLYWSLHIFANYILFFGLEIPNQLTTFSSAIIVTGFMSISLAIPSVAGGAGVVNYGTYVAMILVASVFELNENPLIMRSLVFYSLLIYLSNLLPEIIVGGYYYYLNRKLLFRIEDLK